MLFRGNSFGKWVLCFAREQFAQYKTYFNDCSGVRRGGGELPHNGKYCCRKMVLFPKAVFLASTFTKNSWKFNLSIEF